MRAKNTFPANIYTDVTKELRQSEFEGLDSYFKSEYNKVSNE